MVEYKNKGCWLKLDNRVFFINFKIDIEMLDWFAQKLKFFFLIKNNS